MTEQETTLSFAKILADPTRQRIMHLCCCCWRSVGELVSAMDDEVSQPTVSHHLGVLRRAGLVSSRREGKHVFYTLDQARVVSCCGSIVRAFAPEADPDDVVRSFGGDEAGRTRA